MMLPSANVIVLGTPDDHVKLPPIIAPRMSKADPEPEPVVPPAPGGAEKANDVR
jgi:hypothetical protein